MTEQTQKLLIDNIKLTTHKFTELYKKWSPEDRAYIEQENLVDGRNRMDLSWKLQGYIEKAMYEEGIYDNIDGIIAKVTKQWNEKETFQLLESTVEHYTLKLFKSINHRKAFNEICEADMDGYKQYIQDSQLFAQYTMRQLFTYDQLNVNYLSDIFQWLFTAHFAEQGEDAFNKTIKGIGLSTDKNKSGINMSKGFARGQMDLEQNVPFIKGIEKLFIQLYEQSDRKQLKSTVVSFMNKYVFKKAVKKQQPKAEVKLPEVLQQQEPKVEPAVELVVQPAAEPIAEVSLPALGQIDALIAQLEQLKVTINVPQQPQQPVISEETTNQLKVADEEITRLRHTIASQDEQLKSLKVQTYEQLIELIGGTRSNYLLSDLYKESQCQSDLPREILQGQLLNFFNILSSAMQLEPITNGYNIGEEFDVDRMMLAHQFRVLSAVTSEEEQVRVKLLQYGWTLNGKVIVQPQVTEMKGVH